MITDKVKFYGGLGMLVIFMVLLLIMFSPVFHGRNALEYADELYNSISKDSAYYIPDIKKESAEFNGVSISVILEMEEEERAYQTALLYQESGAEVTTSGTELEISGDLGGILQTCLDDTDAMYHNNGEAIQEKYGYDERWVLYNWWESLEAIDQELNDQGLFVEAKAVAKVMERAVEPAYNYYGIEAERMSDRIGVVLFSLVVYVVYTVWYGFGLMFLLEGWGIKIRQMYPFRFVGRIKLI
ncbi:hypothetical protein ACFLYR_08550 [Chloroflexota bacterium]